MKTSFLASSFVSRLRTGIIALMITSLLSACTTTQMVRFGQPVPGAPEIRPGDDVVCNLRDGTSARFTVTEIDALTIKGRDQAVMKSDVANVEIRRFSPGKTALAVIAAVAIGAALADPLSKIGVGFPSATP